MQLDLFGSNYQPQTEDTRVCNKCGETKDLEDFHVPYYKKNNEKGRSHSCKACITHQRKLLTTLKEIHPKPDDMRCQCCGDTKDVLHLDHNHITDEFRGYICINCNHGLGKFNDSVEKLQKAMDYLNERSPRTTQEADTHPT